MFDFNNARAIKEASEIMADEYEAAGDIANARIIRSNFRDLPDESAARLYDILQRCK